MNSPMRCFLPMGVFNQRFEALFPHSGTLGCAVCLVPQLFLLTYLHVNVGPPAPPVAASLCVLSTQMPCPSLPLVWVSVSSLSPCRTSIHFDFLAVLLFFVFKFVIVLHFCVRGGTVCLPTPPSLGWKSALEHLFAIHQGLW